MTDGEYRRQHRTSIDNPTAFWAEQAEALHWDRRWDSILTHDDPDGAPHWFAGGRLNTCHNAVDRHVEAGRGDTLALIHDSPVTDSVTRYTFRELRDATAALAGALRAHGVGTGDRVVIYMPMVAEAAIAMLACARIGAVHSVVFGGFAAPELAKRIDDARPKLILSASCGIEGSRVIAYKPLLDAALEGASHKPEACIVLQRPQCAAALTAGRDHDWREAVSAAEPAECVPVAATDPLYVLYTSGTTGRPKGVVRDNGGHAVALHYSMRAVYDMGPGEVFWAASDVGWVVGHSYIVYAPLLAGCTTVMYEGKPVGTPDAGAFWRVAADHGVKALFTAPTAFRAIKKEDPKGEHLARYDLSAFEALYLAGERCDPDTITWAGDLLKVPVIDHWWQTETGWPIAGICRGLDAGLDVRIGSAGLPVPGYDIAVVDDDGRPLERDAIGNIVVRQPLPPGTLPTLWRDEDGFREHYLARFPGYYLTGDAGRIDADGYVWVMSRIDDIINVAGHRLSTGAMEEVLAGHPDVAECAVIAVADATKGQLPVGMVVLKAGVERDHDTIVEELIARVRSEIGAVAAFKRAFVVARLPKTRSGKVLRKTMRAIANGESPAVPATIDDPAILDEIAGALGATETG
ncbi:propionyl-CoA synthetase [Algiphilus sp.]|uniref:propionyl-CoA synthetase n=1 Tax=Algiphilus sp. TaxID=1872431 RepID=UPI0025B83088|nr:propionyl-CoA synthetase [Algiphilus sp.]MCK5770519.1 propionyl-CoA synthetase [Algiphilus sp.]